MPESCPIGYVCLQQAHLLMVIGLTVVIFFLYLFNNSYQNQQQQQYFQKILDIKETKSEPTNLTAKKEESLSTELAIYPSQRQHIASKAYERTINPLLPPERSYVSRVPINIPTRGGAGGIQQIGILYKDTVDDTGKQPGNNNENNILPLYGRPTYANSNRWHYYTSSDKYHAMKIPISNGGKECNKDTGCNEISDDDMIDIPAYNGKFKAKVYDIDQPEYIPYV